MKKSEIAVIVSILLISSSANAFEISPLEVKFTAVPASIDIVGVKTGMSVLDAENALRDRGYFKDGRFSEKAFPCQMHECIAYNGRKGYEAAARYVKDSDSVYLRYSPPYAGGAVLEITREISYRGKPLPTFEKLFSDARPKFGRAVVWDKLEKACWDFKNGALLDKPEIDSGRACSSLRRDISEGYLLLHRDGREESVKFYMQDKLIERQIIELQQAAFAEASAEKQKLRQQQMESAATPEL